MSELPSEDRPINSVEKNDQLVNEIKQVLVINFHFIISLLCNLTNLQSQVLIEIPLESLVMMTQLLLTE
jgi:hypothetical protein